MATLRRLFLMLTGGLVLVGSFWLALPMVDYLSGPADPDADLIKVTQASYGLNCRNSASGARQTFQGQAGNATDAAVASCSGTRKLCAYLVDVRRLGDPAPGCGKDLTVEWRCGSDQAPRAYHLAAEANGQTVYIACP